MANSKELCKIYLLTNIVNKKIYIGQTWMELHKRMGKNGVNYINSIHLYNAIQAYGSENFVYTLLETCEDQETADKLEVEHIFQYNSLDSEIGYNIKIGGSVGRHAEATKAKISATLKEQAANWTSEQRAERTKYISGYWEGRERGPQTLEHREQVVKTLVPGAFIGHMHSEETLTKISEASKDMWKSGKMTPESIAKGAQARRMNIEREHAIIKAYQDGLNIADIEEQFNTGRSSIYRALDRNNIPRLNNHTKWSGKTHSEETKQKMSEARKDYWDKK